MKIMKNFIRKIILGIMIVSMGAFISCRDQNNENREESEAITPSPAPDNETTRENSSSEINPAHGEPGHRCDIPVGAPLDQASSQNSGGTSTSSGSPIRLRESTPEKNPPHGQPGHQCSVPVGADL